MTAKHRIAAIRLSQRLDNNPEYAEYIGVRIVNGKAADNGEMIVQNIERDFGLKGSVDYGCERRTVNC